MLPSFDDVFAVLTLLVDWELLSDSAGPGLDSTSIYTVRSMFL